MKLFAAPLPERPAVKTPGFSMETPILVSAVSAPATLMLLPSESRTLLALPSESKFPLTTGAPEIMNSPDSTKTPRLLPVTLPPAMRKLPDRTKTPQPLPVTLPPFRTNTPFVTRTPQSLPPAMEPLPALSAVALESVTTRIPFDTKTRSTWIPPISAPLTGSR